MEDRLNPIAPEGADESTLGGYTAIHGRAPGLEASDGMPYTVAIEVEPADDAVDAWVGYLVFLRWAADSTAIMGHVETDDIARGDSEAEARTGVERLPLTRVKEILEEAIEQRRQWESD